VATEAASSGRDLPAGLIEEAKKRRRVGLWDRRELRVRWRCAALGDSWRLEGRWPRRDRRGVHTETQLLGCWL